MSGVRHYGARWNGEPTTNSELNKAREYCDFLDDLLTPITGLSADGLSASWTSPFILKGGASLYLALWLDDTDSADPIVRVKWGTNQSASPAAGTCRPASINDATSFGVQLFQRTAAPN